MTDEEHLNLRAELDARLAAALDAAELRRQTIAARRGQLAAARTAGLARRHATKLDPGRAAGGQTYPAADPTCRCHHPAAVHRYGTHAGRRTRTACNAAAPTPCPCRLYQPDPTEVARRIAANARTYHHPDDYQAATALRYEPADFEEHRR